MVGIPQTGRSFRRTRKGFFFLPSGYRPSAGAVPVHPTLRFDAVSLFGVCFFFGSCAQVFFSFHDFFFISFSWPFIRGPNISDLTSFVSYWMPFNFVLLADVCHCVRQCCSFSG